MELRRPRGGGLVALGWALAVEGALGKIALTIGALTVLGCAAYALAVARGDRSEALPNVPLLASSAIAWGAGTLVAFTASASAFRRDAERGVRALLAARARSDGEYLMARVLGLTRLLAVLTAGGTLVAGGVAVMAARGGSLALRTALTTAAALAFSLAFAAILAPVALATLAARSRAGGYVGLLLVLVVPELLQGWLVRVLPDGWGELASIPGALSALRGALLPSTVDPLRFARALAVLALVATLALLTVRGQLARFDREHPV